jgi:O-antigen/teichoic acid export membrane protein
VVNRTALPVFARVATVKAQLAQSLAWSLRRLVTLVAPLMVGLMLLADPLTALLHDEQGNDYAPAALPLKLLAAAALLRVTSQLLTPVMMASGGPGTAAKLSGATLLLLSVGILAVGLIFDAQSGIVAVSAVWLAVYPLLLVWGTAYLHRHWDIRLGDLIPAFIAPLIGIGAMVAIVEGLRPLAGGDPAMRIGLVVVAMALTYAGLFFLGRERPATA